MIVIAEPVANDSWPCGLPATRAKRTVVRQIGSIHQRDHDSTMVRLLQHTDLLTRTRIFPSRVLFSISLIHHIGVMVAGPPSRLFIKYHRII